MIPYEAALKSFNEHRLPGSYTWDEMLAWHFNAGFLFSTPRYFICGRPVNRFVGQKALWDYSLEFPVGECDAWYIAIAAGNLSDAWTILPWQLPHIGFDRKGEIRFYETERVRRLTHQPTD